MDESASGRPLPLRERTYRKVHALEFAAALCFRTVAGVIEASLEAMLRPLIGMSERIAA